MHFHLKRDKFIEIEIAEPEGLPLDLSFMRGAFISEPIDPKMIFTTNASEKDSLLQ